MKKKEKIIYTGFMFHSIILNKKHQQQLELCTTLKKVRSKSFNNKSNKMKKRKKVKILKEKTPGF